MKIDLRDTWFE